MATFSFDLVSEINLSEINNVLDLVKRELETRYDFRGSQSLISWLGDKKEGFKIETEDNLKLEALKDIVRKKLAQRNLSQKTLDLSRPIQQTNFKVSQEIPFIVKLDQPKIKQLTTLIRNNYPKAKVVINKETIRVSDNSKDNLQKIIQLIKNTELDFPVQFINFR